MIVKKIFSKCIKKKNKPLKNQIKNNKSTNRVVLL